MDSLKTYLYHIWSLYYLCLQDHKNYKINFFAESTRRLTTETLETNYARVTYLWKVLIHFKWLNGQVKILPAKFEIFIDLAGKIKKIPNLADKIWKIQYLASKIWKIQDLASKIRKIQYLAGKIWKIQDLTTHHSLTRCRNSRRITHQLAGPPVVNLSQQKSWFV